MAEIVIDGDDVSSGMRAGAATQDTTITSVDWNETRLKKFIFDKDAKHTLLQAVRQHNAHRAAHGKKDETFENVKETFIENLPECIWRRYQKPSMKTVRDKLRSMMVARRKTNKRIAIMSGVEEINGPVEELLDEFITEVDQCEEERRRERDELTNRESALTSAGEQIQRNALTRRRSVGDEGTDSSRSTPRKRRLVEEDDEWYAILKRELSNKRETRESELRLRREELELQKARFEEDRKDREHNREQSRKQLELLISLVSQKKSN